MLSVCVLEKQRLAYHLIVYGFITEGERERETDRAVEREEER